MPNPPKRTTDMRPAHVRQGQEPPAVFVDPGVSPEAAAYAAGMAARRQRKMAPPKYDAPVGGGPPPPIPRLDQPEQQGLTMSQQAERTNSPQPGSMVRQAAQNASIVEPPMDFQQMQAARQALQGRAGPELAAQLGLQPGDMLPEEALRDPQAQQGPGSAYAVSQPHLVLRYGVIRNGRRIPPQQLKQSRPGQLSPQTLEGLQAMQQAQAKAAQAPTPEGLPQTEEEAERQAEEGAASQSARAARQEMSEAEKKEVEEAINAMDSFDYDGFRQRMERDVLNNDEQRKIIRGRCKPLSLDDLILKNRVSQDVPIIPPGNGKSGFVVRYTSMTGEEDLALKQLVMQESKSIEVTDRYLLDKFAFMAIACGLTAINGNPAPTHLDEKGNFKEEYFWKKFNWVLKRPIHMLASIGVNHTWFEQDVRKLFVAEKLGNG